MNGANETLPVCHFVRSSPVWLVLILVPTAGVYKAGFATDQEGYDKGVRPVFSALDRLEALVKKNGGPFVFGDTLTETDVWVRISYSVGSREF